MQRLPRYRTGDAELDTAIADLIDRIGDVHDADLVFELIVSAVRLARDRADRGDLKIANAALKEMRYAFTVFEPYRSARKAAIFGSARTQPRRSALRADRRLARELAAADWMVITGAGPGIMEAGIEGAGAENSFGVSIRLPFEAATTQFLADDPKLVNFRYFFTRKVTFVKEAHAFVLLPGGFGTLDEAFELLTLVQTGKAQPGPIVLLDVPGGTYWQSWLEFVQRELRRPPLHLARRHDAVLHHRRRERSRSRRSRASTATTTRCASSTATSCCACSTSPTPRCSTRLNAEFADIVVSGRDRAHRRDAQRDRRPRRSRARAAALPLRPPLLRAPARADRRTTSNEPLGSSAPSTRRRPARRALRPRGIARARRGS